MSTIILKTLVATPKIGEEWYNKVTEQSIEVYGSLALTNHLEFTNPFGASQWLGQELTLNSKHYVFKIILTVRARWTANFRRVKSLNSSYLLFINALKETIHS